MPVIAKIRGHSFAQIILFFFFVLQKRILKSPVIILQKPKSARLSKFGFWLDLQNYTDKKDMCTLLLSSEWREAGARLMLQISQKTVSQFVSHQTCDDGYLP